MCYNPVTDYGTPGDPWATRFAAAEAATDNICVPPGVYDIGSNLTLSKNWQILDGAVVKPASGVTVTFTGTLDAARYRIFDVSSGGFVSLQAGSTEFLPPQWWDDADDTDAIQGALNAAAGSGIPVDLGALSYAVSATLQVSGDVEIVGGESGALVVTSAKNHHIFTTSSGANNVGIRRIRAAGERGLLQIGASFETITVTDCDFEGIADVITNYFVYSPVAAGYTATALHVCRNNLQKCTAVYVDGLTVTDLVFDDNVVTDGTRFLIRARNTLSTGPDSSNGPTRVSVCRNRIFGINTALSNLADNVARVLQTSAVESITMTDNYIERLVTNDTGTVVYWGFGSLEFGRNTVKYVESSTTGDRIISDKTGSTSDPGRYSHKCYANTFDQTGVPLEKTPDAVYHIYAAQNFVSDGDIFIGCICPTHRVWHSVTSDLLVPKNIVFQNATVYDHQYPSVVELLQFQENVVVRGFTVHKISNPYSLVGAGSETRLRFVSMYSSFSANVPSMNNIQILDNTILEAQEINPETASTFVIAFIHRHPNAAYAELKNVVVSGNVTRQAAALCRFISGAQPIGAVTLTHNVAPVATISVGTVPAGLVLTGNSPAPSGSSSWTPGSIAAGATVTTTITVTGARLADYAQIAADVNLQSLGLRLEGAVTSANTVTATLANTTGSSVTPGTFNVHARVTYR